MNWKQAFALGLIAPGIMKSKPVVNLYCGYKLPELNIWNKTTHPYAVILSWGGVCYLTVSESAIYLRKTYTVGGMVETDGPAISYKAVDGVWVRCDTATVTGAILWNSHDLTKRGSTYVYTYADAVTELYDTSGLYSYNGAVLPNLPADYNPAVLPYVTMIFYPNWEVELWCTSSPATFNPEDGHIRTLYSGKWSYYRSFDDGFAPDFEWDCLSFEESLSAGQPGDVAYWDFVAWTNYDLKNELDGTIWMPKSNPVPLYE